MLFVQYPSWIKPEIFPFLPIRWYGLMYVVGFFTGYMIIAALIKKEKKIYMLEKLPNLFLWAFLGMILFARLASELIYNRNLLILIQPWLLIWPFHNGQFVGIQGMSYHGGMVGIVLSTLLYCKVHKIDFLAFSDKAAISAAFGYTFGRIGNFTNGELYGRITTSPLGMIFPRAELLPIADPRVAQVAEKVGLEANQLGLINVPRHASQLYEALFEGLITGLILLVVYTIVTKKQKYIPGIMFALYIILYGVFRFFIEYFRKPDTGLDFILRFSDTSNPNWLFVSPFNFTTGQVLSGIMVFTGLLIYILLVVANKNKKNKIRMKLTP